MADFLTPAYAQLQALGSVALAMVLGALVGIDREITNRPAGLRTHMLVAGASALLVSLGDVLIEHFSMELRDKNLLASDPIRIIGAVITGVSFLGAGTIIHGKSDGSVKGLTTAASLLFVAGVGICVALSQLVLAVGVTILALITLRGLRPIERWLGPDHQS